MHLVELRGSVQATLPRVSGPHTGFFFFDIKMDTVLKFSGCVDQAFGYGSQNLSSL